MEAGAGIAEALLAGAEGAEVLGGLGHDVVEEVELDAAVCGAVRGLDVEVAVDDKSVSDQWIFDGACTNT